jgi:hypothetical protein
MLGLMCTLIPLGPGIVAMGRGNVAELSMSLLVAFDGTVAGLVAAVVTMAVTAVRKRWYGQYILVLESLMTAVLDKANSAREAGVSLPHGAVNKVNNETNHGAANAVNNEENHSAVNAVDKEANHGA